MNAELAPQYRGWPFSFNLNENELRDANILMNQANIDTNDTWWSAILGRIQDKDAKLIINGKHWGHNIHINKTLEVFSDKEKHEIVLTVHEDANLNLTRLTASCKITTYQPGLSSRPVSKRFKLL